MRKFVFRLAAFAFLFPLFAAGAARAGSDYDAPSEADIRKAVNADFRSFAAATLSSLAKGFCPDAKPAKPAPEEGLKSNPLSKICEARNELDKLSFAVHKIGCVEAQENAGYNCDYILDPSPELQSIVWPFSLIIPEKQAANSRFILYQSNWYVVHPTSPFRLNNR
jgi:hypothetical protein